MTPDSFDARMGAILRLLIVDDGMRLGYTSAEVAEALNIDPREAAAKLRSLKDDGLCEAATWERPRRYWTPWKLVLTMRYLDALADEGKQP